MMRKKLLLTFLFSVYFLQAQVGVNTSAPQTTLDVRGKNDTTPNGVSTPGAVDPKDGVLVPRVTDLTANGTVNGQLVYLVQNAGSFNKGFYYWDSTKWTSFGGSSSTAATEWYLAGGTTDAAGDKTGAVYRTGNIGVGANTTPNAYTMLDVSSTNKGILIPRVNLTSNTLDLNSDGDNSISNQPAGLLIYNSGTTLAAGYYFWNGSEWRGMDNSTSTAPSISTLVCAGATLTPGSYTTGVAYVGNLKVPYTGGNGGVYSSGSPVTVNGLTFKLRSGKLEYGSGELVFSVTGTPTVSSPTATAVPIEGSTGNNIAPFVTNALKCTASVGASSDAVIATRAVIGPLVLNNEGGYDNYHLVGTTPDGKFSVRIKVESAYAFAYADVQIRSNSGSKTIIWNYDTEYLGNDMNGAMNALTLTSGGVWYGSYDASTTASTLTGNATSGSFSAWGDPDIYYYAPERRRYTWTTDDTTDKVMYEAILMLGAPNSAIVANATNCPNGVCTQTKAYIKIEQVNAP